MPWNVHAHASSGVPPPPRRRRDQVRGVDEAVRVGRAGRAASGGVRERQPGEGVVGTVAGGVRYGTAGLALLML